MKGKDKIRQSELSPAGRQGLKCYFSLLTREDNVCWIKASGFSMLPLFWPGCRVRLNTGLQPFAVGQVVVFPDGGKLIAHRIIACEADSGTLLTKGDTLCAFDKPTAAEDVIGVIDFIDYYGQHLWVGADHELAELSADLGRRLGKKRSDQRKRAQTIWYCCLFFPAFIWLQVRRKFKK